MMQPPDRAARARIAESYTALTQKGYFSDRIGGNERYLGKLMTHLVPPQAKSLLEVGGATGLWAEDVLRQRPALLRVTAVEISDAAQQYQERIGAVLQHRPDSLVSVLQADFFDIEAQLSPADVVVSSFVAEYMGNTSDFLSKLYRLVAPGGCLIFADVLTHSGSAGSGIHISAMVESLALICGAYLREGMAPPVIELVRSTRFYGLYNEDSFRELTAYHDTYKFPKEAWTAEQQKYPKAKFYNLGIAGVLMLPKPR